ncbi:MAG: SDR family NAD(P)-dependent oxidoreductase [Planctomycetota bacterium]|nr:SDR family NAD(P)-dependent oxidoreductase [Planctomycetota bacterium]
MSQNPSKPAATTDQAIAIIGIGCMFPGSQDHQGYWAGIRDGRDMIEEIPEGYWNPDDYHDGDKSSADRTYGRRGGFLTPVPFNPLEFGIAPRDLEATDTSQLLSLIAARQALIDAGYDPRTTFDRSRTSVILGVTGALELVVPLGARLGHPHWWRALRESGIDEKTASEVVKRISDSYVSWQENSFPGLLGNVVAGRIANRLDLHGTNCVTDAACASSLAALHMATLELRSGRSDMVITGGVDTFNDIFMYMCFSKTPALSPTGDARPFDGNGDGTILGEGIGLVVLKRLDDAVRDGDRIYARLLSIGTSSDGRGSAIYAPTVEGQQRALQDAYQQASISPSTIGLVEAHGTGTSVGDAIELRALQEVYSREGGRAHRCALGSVKSQIGHTKAASGAAGLIKAVLALHHKVQPPSIKIRQPLDTLRESDSPFHIEEIARPWVQHPDHPRRAAVSSFGFGGSNFHAVLEENSAGRIETDWNDCALLFSYSATARNSLLQQLEHALTEVKNLSQSVEIDAVARDSRTRFKASDDHRISIVVGRSSDAAARLQTALEAVQQEQETRWSLPTGIDRDHGPRRGSLAVIFPGQGSQRVDMLRSTACRFPEMIQVVDDAERVFWNQQEDSRLASKIWPPRDWSDDPTVHEDALRQTDVAQPALGAVSLGLYRVLARFGIQGEMFGGHSFGELTALAAAGRLGETDFHQLANFRGRLMARAGGDEAGSMLAVALPIGELERFVEQNCPHLIIANRNAPQQAVLSGSAPAISDAMRILEQRGIRHRKLPVAAAFHSPEVASAATPFEDVLKQARIHSTALPVFSNSTGRRYPDSEPEARSLLSNQIALPVQFMGMIEEMVHFGATTFLEVGPGQVLTGLIQSILAEVSPQSSAIGIDAQRVDGTDLARAIGRLAVEGHPVDLCAWDPRTPLAKTDEAAMVVMIGGANLKPGEVTAAISSTAVAPPKNLASVATEIPVLPMVPSRIPSASSAMIPSTVASDEPSTEGSGEMVSRQASSQETLMQAIEAALAMQRTLAEAQRAAEQVLEASLTATPPPPTALPTAPKPTTPTLEKSPSIEPIAAEDGLTELLVEVVANKTGYPSEAIATDLDLEGDLGIDSIKRVEILSALREHRPDLKAIPPEMLGTLRTIDAIVSWYRSESNHRPASPTPPELIQPPEVVAPSPQNEGTRSLQHWIREVIADKTGYPIDAIATDLDLEADLGIDSIKRVEIFSALRERRTELPAIPPERLGTLRTIDSIVEWYSASGQAPTETDPEPAIASESSAISIPQPPESSLATSSAHSDHTIRDTIVTVVADKTGYPAEAIGTDLDLEADLGIDSIKRVEILSALREQRPELPAIPPELLGTLRSIDAIVDWYRPDHSSATDDRAAARPTRVEANPGSKSADLRTSLQDPSNSPVANEPIPEVKILEAVAVARPVPRVTGASSWIPTPGRSLVVVCDAPALGAALVARLGASGISAVQASLASIEDGFPAAISATLGGLLLVVDSPSDPDPAMLHSFQWLRETGKLLLDHDGDSTPLVALVQRFDGRFGLGEFDPTSRTIDPACAALSGMAKCAAREWPTVQVRSIDWSPQIQDERQAVDSLVVELLEGHGMEVGLTTEERFEIHLEPLAIAQPSKVLMPKGALVVVTGGARGVTAACVDELARRYQPSLLLLGRTAEPGSEPKWADAVADDQLENHLFRNLTSGDSPARIREQAMEIRKIRDLARHLDELRSLGCEVDYRSLDVRDRAELTRCIDEARAKHGPVRGIIHGAGVLADRWICDKSDQQFEQVWTTKVDPARHLLSICRDEALDFISFFSSTTARLGRKGQSDYAAANEVLNRMATLESVRRVDCQVYSLGWGPWAGGMVHEGLRSVFHDEGIDLIPLPQGARIFVEKMESTGPAQRILLAPLGSIADAMQQMTVFGNDSRLVRDSDRKSGTSAGRSSTTVSSTTVSSSTVAANTVAAPRNSRMEAGQTLSLSIERIPAMKDHVLNGRAVVPAAFLLEWSAQAALHRHPGLELQGIDDFKILKGVILDPREEQQVIWMTGTPESRSDHLRVPVEIRSCAADQRLHARAQVLLGERTAIRSNLMASEYSGDGDPGYSTQLFHGPRFHCIQKVSTITATQLSIRSEGTSKPSTWFDDPTRSDWLIDPLRIDALFQALILWSRAHMQTPCLPCGIAKLRIHSPLDSGLLETRIQVNSTIGSIAIASVEILNRTGSPAITIEGAEVVIDASLDSAFQRDRLTEEARP